MRGGFRRRTRAAAGARAAWVAIAALSCAFLLKLAVVVLLHDHPLAQPTGDLDAAEYTRLAARVRGGDIWLRETPAYLSLLYVYVLAALQIIGGGSHIGVLVGQAALGTGAVWAVARAARLWSDRRTSWLAGALLMLTGVVALQEAVILQSAIDPLLTALFLLAWSRALLRGGQRAWLLTGLALALLGLNRPNALLLAALVLPAAIWRSRPAWHGGGAVVLGMLLALLPFGVREGVATGEWRLLPAHGGLNFFIGNHAEATGTYTALPDVTPSMAGQREDTRRVAERATGRSLTDGQVSAWFTMRGLTWWREAPADAARLFVRKLWLSVNAHELPVNHSYAWFRAEVAIFSVLVIGAWCLMPLGLTALICGRPAAPPAVGGWRWFRGTMPLYLFGVALFSS